MNAKLIIPSNITANISSSDVTKTLKRSINDQKSAPQSLSRSITLEELRKFFHLPIAEVARQFGTCTTALKKICRKLNITKWPYRQILSLTKSIQSLEMAVLNDAVASELRAQYRDQIIILQKAIAEVMRNPSKAMESMNLSALTAEMSEQTDTREEQEDEEFEKSEFDVQQIISAASAVITQTDRPLKKKSKFLKRKSAESDEENEFTEETKKQDTAAKVVNKSSVISPQTITNNETIDTSNKQMAPIGLSHVQYIPFSDSHKLQFVGQVLLAPLQRKKFRPDTNRKVVPLMEPDIGSNFFIEIVPNMIVGMLQKSLDVDNIINSENAISLLLPTMIQTGIDCQESNGMC